MSTENHGEGPLISIAVRAWNEETVIEGMLESLFQQTLFKELSRLNAHCEILCIPNGCTDATPEIASTVFRRQQESHPYSHAFSCRVENVKIAGRNHTWNLFVHSMSHREAKYLYLIDSDILFHGADTLLNLYLALIAHPEASVSGGRQYKDIYFKTNRSVGERISIATSDMTRTIKGQITGQLYCIRAEIARNIYLPEDLGAPDDGFIKQIVCTDFLTKECDASRVVIAENAAHIFEAYMSPQEILNNQKRQMIGQTIVYVLLEHLKTWPAERRENLAAELWELDQTDPPWLSRLVGRHLAQVRFFWEIFPGAMTFRIQRWWKLKRSEMARCLPATLVGTGVSIIACARAHRHFRNGGMHYWPKAQRGRVQELNPAEAVESGSTAMEAHVR